MTSKSTISVEQTTDVNALGGSYYIFCLEQALANLQQARMLVKDDIIDDNHELPLIEKLLKEAIAASSV